MTENQTQNTDEADEKQKAFWEKARKGVLNYLDEKGGTLPLGEMHEYSLNKFFIQHQRFSQMMESFVDEELIEFDQGKNEATINDITLIFDITQLRKSKQVRNRKRRCDSPTLIMFFDPLGYAHINPLVQAILQTALIFRISIFNGRFIK